MSHLNPLSPHLTDAQRDKVVKMAQENLDQMFADEHGRLTKLARDCDQRAYQMFPVEDRTRDIARESFLRAAGLLVDDAATFLAEQIEEAMSRPHALIENYFLNNPGVRRFLPIALASDRFRKLSILADQAFDQYSRQFSSPSGRPTLAPMGVTVESEWSTGATPDTRLYGIVARTPGTRRPITSQIDFNDYVRDLEVEPMCDLQMNGLGCDYNLSAFSRLSSPGHIVNSNEYVPGPVSTPIPFVRGDVIVFLWICDACWMAYCEKHGISQAQIVDADDVID